MLDNFEQLNNTAELLKVLAHPIRLCIVCGLIQKGESNVNCIKDCLGIPQSTVSQHLQKLRVAGIVKGERNGLEINYSISSPKIEKFIRAILEIE